MADRVPDLMAALEDSLRTPGGRPAPTGVTETATEVIAGWLAARPGASGRYAHGYRRDAEELVERLRSSQIGFRYHGGRRG